jgi:hypothetical protein
VFILASTALFPQVLLAASGCEGKDLALAAGCAVAKLSPAPAGFRIRLLGALLAHPDRSVRVGPRAVP